MSWATIREAIAADVEDVTGIGQIHEFLRHTTFWDEYIKRHKKDGRINNWEITRRSLAQKLFAVQNLDSTEPFFHDDHEAVIIGRMALNDDKETEKTFQDVIDGVVTKFRQNNQLGGIAIIPQQPQVPIIEHRTFGGTLVHYTEVVFPVRERVGG
jgi:hypothetical protein